MSLIIVHYFTSVSCFVPTFAVLVRRILVVAGVVELDFFLFLRLFFFVSFADVRGVALFISLI